MPSSHSIKTLLKGESLSNHTGTHSSHKSASKHPAGTAQGTVNGSTNPPAAKNNPAASSGEDKASDHALNSGSRKRSMLLNMVLPPEAPPVDATLALPPVVLFPPALDSEGPVVIRSREMTPVQNSTKAKVKATNATSSKEDSSSSTSTPTTAASSTSRSLRAWVWGDAAEAQITKRVNAGLKDSAKGDHHGVVQSVNVVETESTTIVSKTTQIRTWISKIARSDGHDKSDAVHGAEKQMVARSENQPQEHSQDQQVATRLQQGDSGDGVVDATKTTTTTTTTTVQHQEIHHRSRSVALVSVNVSVSDVFGLGKVMEVILALFHAHGAFLRRQPFWMQCSLMAWEGLVVLLLLWGVLRVVGLAEVIVWGADDLVRGTLSTIQVVGRTMLAYFSE
ncbi:hypothetical protein KVV02_007840 [Mortierella alpina]|uniref:Uncharacterized protein n=1 Tax=Mortierella alpina TaxID=64518 RepID=A0A9P8D1I4_MORAP|nr:hypothetical protein KVV02_007840 [Mortierella alpina]